VIAALVPVSKHGRRRAKTSAAGGVKRPVRADGWTVEELRRRRELLFNRAIDYIPCRQFLKADAEALAPTLPFRSRRRTVLRRTPAA